MEFSGGLVVKDPLLSLLWLGWLPRRGFDLWPRDFRRLQVWPKKKKKSKTLARESPRAVVLKLSFRKQSGFLKFHANTWAFKQSQLQRATSPGSAAQDVQSIKVLGPVTKIINTTFQHYYKNSFALVNLLKGSQTYPMTPKPHFENVWCRLVMVFPFVFQLTVGMDNTMQFWTIRTSVRRIFERVFLDLKLTFFPPY